MPEPHFYDELPSDPYALPNCCDVAAIIGVHPVCVVDEVGEVVSERKVPTPSRTTSSRY